MPKQPRINGIKALRCYTFEEAADVTGVSARTVRSWAKAGLIVMESARPILIRGDDILAFLKRQRAARKITVGSDEFFCLACRAARKPAGNTVDCRLRGERAALTAHCERCGTVLHKPVAASALPNLARTLDVTISR